MPCMPMQRPQAQMQMRPQMQMQGLGQSLAPQFAQLLAGPPQWLLLPCQVRCLRTGQGLTGTIWAGRGDSAGRMPERSSGKPGHQVQAVGM